MYKVLRDDGDGRTKDEGDEQIVCDEAWGWGGEQSEWMETDEQHKGVT
jgi:hypothetical protein